MKVAALDLGSNTFLCLIAEVSSQGVEKVYADTVEVVRLGQGLGDSKNFHPDALLRAEACLKKMSELIAVHRPKHVLAMATAAARQAENKEKLFSLGKKFGIPIEIIPGEKEASITYEGAVSGLPDARSGRLIVDIGGGSTEFIFGRGSELVAGESFNIGVVKLTEKFISQQPTSAGDIETVQAHIKETIEKAKALQRDGFKLEQIVAVAGTPTSLVAAEIGEFNPVRIDGYVLTNEKLMDWQSRFVRSSVEEKIKMGIPAGRADVILVGTMILRQTLNTFSCPQLSVSTRGVRYGVALEMGRRYLPQA